MTNYMVSSLTNVYKVPAISGRKYSRCSWKYTMSWYFVSSPHPPISVLEKLHSWKVKRYQQHCSKGRGKNMLTLLWCLSHIFLPTLYLAKIVDSYSIFLEIGGRSNLICLFDSFSLKLYTHSIIAFICISSIDVLHIMNKLWQYIIHICANKIYGTSMYEVKYS